MLDTKRPRQVLGYQVADKESLNGEMVLFHPATQRILYSNRRVGVMAGDPLCVQFGGNAVLSIYLPCSAWGNELLKGGALLCMATV